MIKFNSYTGCLYIASLVLLMINKNKIIWILVIIIFSLLLFLAFIFYWKNLRGAGPAIWPSAGDIVKELEKAPGPAENKTEFPLKLPDGFSISIFAKDLPGARVMEFDTFGNMWVSQTSEGIIAFLGVKDGKVENKVVALKNLRKPHGIVFDPDDISLLYVAEENKISRVRYAPEGGSEKIADLPYGAGHFTRTIGFGPDGRLYLSIGSSCNVCNESDSRRAKIFSMNKDGGDFKEFAGGLRNSVFFTWHPRTGQMWATEMGRDLIGDDIPPDEINVIDSFSTGSGQNSAVPNFGWPNCYGKNIHDNDFDHNTYIRNPCMEPFEKGSHIDFQAHSAPLGLAFVPEGYKSNPPTRFWPLEYWNNLIVAFHGSWNRTKPTGYKLVRIKLDAQGNYLGMEDFITGWYEPQQGVKGPDGALGRPVDVKFGPDGALYVSDDKAGLIYRIKYNK